MPHDPVRISETKAWLAKAALDLRAAGVDAQADPPLLEDALFHCQQAIEKTLKAFLTWHDRPFRKTHDLIESGMECAGIDSSLEPLLRQAAPLTEYAWKYRYPGPADVPEKAEVAEAVEKAKDVFHAISERLPKEARV